MYFIRKRKVRSKLINWGEGRSFLRHTCSIIEPKGINLMLNQIRLQIPFLLVPNVLHTCLPVLHMGSTWRMPIIWGILFFCGTYALVSKVKLSNHCYVVYSFRLLCRCKYNIIHMTMHKFCICVTHVLAVQLFHTISYFCFKIFLVHCRRFWMGFGRVFFNYASFPLLKQSQNLVVGTFLMLREVFNILCIKSSSFWG